MLAEATMRNKVASPPFYHRDPPLRGHLNRLLEKGWGLECHVLSGRQSQISDLCLVAPAQALMELVYFSGTEG